MVDAAVQVLVFVIISRSKFFVNIICIIFLLTTTITTLTAAVRTTTTSATRTTAVRTTTIARTTTTGTLFTSHSIHSHFHCCDRHRRIDNEYLNRYSNTHSNIKMSLPPSSTTSSSSPPQQQYLSMEQLRWKRLVAFGIENSVPLSTAACSTTAVSLSKDTPSHQKHHPPNTSRPPENDVIDLLEDTSDDDDDKAKKPKRSFVEGINRSNQQMSTTSTTTTKSASGLCSRTSADGTFCFQVATWNVWFGPWGDGNPHSNLRMKAIVRLLMEQHHQQQQPQQPEYNPLYCIGFQEVVAETVRPLKSLLQQEQHSYRWFEQPSQTVPYKCAMAIHTDLTILEHGWIPYTNTVMQRGFLYVRAKLPSSSTSSTAVGTSNTTKDEILFTTTHLESYNGKDYNGAPERLLQIQEMCQFLQDQMEQYPSVSISMISGDLNWDDERRSIKRTTATATTTNDPVLLSSIPAHWKDTWLEATQPSPSIPISTNTTASKTKKKKTAAPLVEGYTYDGKLNPMLSGSLRRRFDRVLVFQNHDSDTTRNRQQLHILAPQLLGTNVISPDLTWEKYNTYTRTTRDVPTAPSDHFGYIVTLRLDKEKS